jgi:hypothetical protein
VDLSYWVGSGDRLDPAAGFVGSPDFGSASPHDVIVVEELFDYILLKSGPSPICFLSCVGFIRTLGQWRAESNVSELLHHKGKRNRLTGGARACSNRHPICARRSSSRIMLCATSATAGKKH